MHDEQPSPSPPRTEEEAARERPSLADEPDTENEDRRRSVSRDGLPPAERDALPD
jgi:hypothetical protein